MAEDKANVIYELIADLTCDTDKAVENLEKFEKVFDKIETKMKNFEQQIKSAFGLAGLTQQIKNVNNAIDNAVGGTDRGRKALSPEEQAKRASEAREKAALRYEQKFSKYYNGLYGVVKDEDARGKLADAATQSAEGLRNYNKILENHKEEIALQKQMNQAIKDTEQAQKRIDNAKAEAVRKEKADQNEAERARKRDLGQQVAYWSRKRSLMNLGMGEDQATSLARGFGKEVSVEAYNRALIAQKEINTEKRRQIQLEKQAEREALRTAKALEKQKTTVGDLLNDVFNIRNSLIFLTLAEVSRGMIDTTNKIQGVRATFTALTKDAKKTNEEINWIFETSNRYGQISLDAAQNYARFFAATKNIMPLNNIRYIYDSMMMASQVLHLTPESFQMMSLAIEQMASKGKIASEELRRQLGQHLPGAIDLAARAMGIKQDQLLEKIKNGQVKAAEFLPLFAKAIRDEYIGGMKAAMESSMVALNRLINTWNEFKIKVGDSGFIKGLTIFATSLMQAMESPSMMMLAEGIGQFTYALAQLMPYLTTFIGLILGKQLWNNILKLKELEVLGDKFKIFTEDLRLFQKFGGNGMLARGFFPALIAFIGKFHVWALVASIIVALFTKLYQRSIGFKNLWDSIMGVFKSLFSGIGRWFGDLFKIGSKNNFLRPILESAKDIDHTLFMWGERIKQLNHQQNVYDLAQWDKKKRSPEQLGWELQKIYAKRYINQSMGDVNINNYVSGTSSPTQTASHTTRKTVDSITRVMDVNWNNARRNLGTT